MGISRRRLVATLGAGAVAMAGCAGSGSSEGADCSTSAVSQDDPEIVQQAVARSNDGQPVLDITFVAETAEASGTTYLDLFDASGQLQHRIPVDDQRTYSISLGQSPIHGVYRISAVDGEGTEQDSLTVEFSCSEKT